MKQIKITIKDGKVKLHTTTCHFNTYLEAQNYAMGLCRGMELGGMNPNRMILKEIKD